jgi:hypothetical protein
MNDDVQDTSRFSMAATAAVLSLYTRLNTVRGFCTYIESITELYLEIGGVFKRPLVHLCRDSDESNITVILPYSTILSFFSFPSLSSPLHFFIRPHPKFSYIENPTLTFLTYPQTASSPNSIFWLIPFA